MPAGGAATSTNVAAILKTVWPPDVMEEFQYKDAPLYAMLTKETDWSGEARVIPVQFGHVTGRSNTFANAKANKGPSQVRKMTVTTNDNFALWSIDHKLIKLSRNDVGAVRRAVEFETKSANYKFKRSQCRMLYRNHGGAIGQIASGYTTTTITLTSKYDCRHFEYGDPIRFSATDGTSGSLQGSAPVFVTGVNPQLGTVTLDAAPSSQSATASSYCFIDGDFSKAWYGIDDYITSADPNGSTVPNTIWGMTRNDLPVHLSGIRVGGAGLLIEEALKKALNECDIMNAETTHIFCHPQTFINLETSLGTRRRYSDAKVGDVGFTGIEFASRGAARPISVFADADCPLNLVYLLNLETWTMASAGNCPDFLTVNGEQYLTELDANSWEGRVGAYGQVYCTAPGKNCRLDLTSATP